MGPDGLGRRTTARGLCARASEARAKTGRAASVVARARLRPARRRRQWERVSERARHRVWDAQCCTTWTRSTKTRKRLLVRLSLVLPDPPVPSPVPARAARAFQRAHLPPLLTARAPSPSQTCPIPATTPCPARRLPPARSPRPRSPLPRAAHNARRPARTATVCLRACARLCVTVSRSTSTTSWAGRKGRGTRQRIRSKR